MPDAALSSEQEIEWLNQCVFSLTVCGCYAAALELLEEALALARAINAQDHIAGTLENMRHLYYMQGDLENALVKNQQVVAVARQFNNIQEQHSALTFLVDTYVERNMFDEAKAALKMLTDFIVEHNLENRIEIYYLTGNIALHDGQVEQAKTDAQVMHSQIRSDSDPALKIACWRLLARVAAKLNGPLTLDGNPYSASACYNQAAQIATDASVTHEAIKTKREWARYEEAQDNRGHSKRLLAEADALEATLCQGDSSTQ